ncbi:MAG TPA: sulfotransferase [Thermoplasmata archaeon]|jgi:omega-hydroxy-beta-dihydromenaquinone-9 sulfotransferase|nr:MAG TPA: sulfotransferase [Thermoplasmata archaeon]
MDFDNAKEIALCVKNTPLPGYTLPNFLRLLTQNKFNIDAQYIPRMIYSLTLSTVMLPFYIKERFQYDRRTDQTEITNSPLFIIGHWRSGTTYLHNALSMDKNLGYFTTFQAYLPGVFLGSEKVFKPLVASSIPKKRPMDDVAMDAEFPQEDQYAIGAFSPYSYYHGWCFPKNMELYNNSVCMDGVQKDTIDEWKRYYLYLLKKITLHQKGKQLVLKNQDNTGKIKILLEMFPNSKFIYLYRNPYDLYFSMMKFMRVTIPRYCIQKPPKIEDIEDSMMDLYARMVQKYIKEREHIPKGNLVQVRYEDYITQPLQEIEHIYEALHLEGFRDAEPAFRSYIRSQKSIKTDRYIMNDDIKQKIKKKWGFAVKEFGY